MYDSFFMGRFESFRNLPGIVERRINRQRAWLYKGNNIVDKSSYPA